jgi:hypothetical protein
MESLSTLVKAAQCGDLEAFEKIVGLFQNMAYAIAYSILNRQNSLETGVNLL